MRIALHLVALFASAFCLGMIIIQQDEFGMLVHGHLGLLIVSLVLLAKTIGHAVWLFSILDDKIVDAEYE